MDSYKYSPEAAFNRIKADWTKWAKPFGSNVKWIVGISGGKDSTVVAALAARTFGRDNVIGVLLPCGEQKDIDDSLQVCSVLGIKNVTVNIGKTFNALLAEVEHNALYNLGIGEASYDTVTNMPARLRMTTLYAVAQSIGGIVLNTSNRSENVVSFATLYGDHAGSYAPIQNLTVTEVMELGDWLGLPHNLVHKVPVDGLQPKTDEEKLGVTYKEIDAYIRKDEATPEVREKVNEYYGRGKFKLEIVKMPGPEFNDLPDKFRDLMV